MPAAASGGRFLARVSLAGGVSRMLGRSHVTFRLTAIAVVLLSGLAIGCGSDKGGRVSGKVTFKGQPVPAGKVYIKPDSSKGNSGQTGFASITNGTYDTAAAGGQGGPSGAVIISVEGIDPNPPPGAGPDVTTTLLFPSYDIKAELSAGASVQDIDVPAEAANVRPAQGEGAPTAIVP
jgi:hypothetical protein